MILLAAVGIDVAVGSKEGAVDGVALATGSNDRAADARTAGASVVVFVKDGFMITDFVVVGIDFRSSVGALDGIADDGATDGDSLAKPDGATDKTSDGLVVAAFDGRVLGAALGPTDGASGRGGAPRSSVGCVDGAREGLRLGLPEEAKDGTEGG